MVTFQAEFSAQMKQMNLEVFERISSKIFGFQLQLQWLNNLSRINDNKYIIIIITLLLLSIPETILSKLKLHVLANARRYQQSIESFPWETGIDSSADLMLFTLSFMSVWEIF